jgi:hypothetical protein
LLVGSFAVGAFLDGVIDKTITVYGNVDSNFKSVSGLCLDPFMILILTQTQQYQRVKKLR